MSPENNQNKDTTWFMINLIMSTDAGKLEKIDWDAFTEKMGISSKGAAMKRYERLLASYGLTSSYATKAGVLEPGTPEARKSSAGPKTPAPKRKNSKRKRGNPTGDNDLPEGADGKA